MTGNDLVYKCHHLFRTATSWIRGGWRSLCGRERRQTKLKDKLPWPELWWVTLYQSSTRNHSLCLIALACCIHTPYFLRKERYYCRIVVLNWQLGVFFWLAVAGVYQSKKVPNHYKCGDGEWRGGVSPLQAAVPAVDGKGSDSRSGQRAHKGESR